ncbi:uncharacterized protein LOC101212066 [Cucumis sativus]|uniref:Uncharacterized protein n=1 Tax=Cucumis sativus TaxID=3659 RepID=A0A0A0KNC3_CUCSA|nr:uncharacterized protein LOC101212066 [Cucumis sativus]KGN51068.1 hypothetical protein Csa_009396 [Cucumis sativus]
MAEAHDSDDRNTTVPVEEEDASSHQSKGVCTEDQTVYEPLRRLIAEIFFPDEIKGSLFHRVKVSVTDNGPAVAQACRNFGRDVLSWTRRGSPLRALLVISVGTIVLLAMTGSLIFLFFFLAATLNAIIISLLVSLAAVGGFLALFFACVTAIYVGALGVALFVISTATISAIVAVVIAAGWIGFFCMVWLAIRKSFGLAKRSVSASNSAISAFSYARRAHKD